MERMRRLRDGDVPYLRRGDQLVLEPNGALRDRVIIHGTMQEIIEAADLRPGETYKVYSTKEEYKPGEGTHLGWTVELDVASAPKIVFEYFVVPPNLETMLAQRKEAAETRLAPRTRLTKRSVA